MRKTLDPSAMYCEGPAGISKKCIEHVEGEEEVWRTNDERIPRSKFRFLATASCNHSAIVNHSAARR